MNNMQNETIEQTKTMTVSPLPQTGFLRMAQIIGNKKANIPGLIPISKSTFWSWVKTGRLPRPTKLSAKISVWRIEDIIDLIRSENGV